MAEYSVTQMTAGVLGEVLTGGTTYTFEISTQEHTAQNVYFGSATFMVDSSTITNTNLQGSSTNAKVGSLWPNERLPFSSPNVTTTVNDTFTFDVAGGIRGSGATITLTSTAGVITEGFVTSQTGSNFISGDSITISQNDLQAAGFANANRSAIMDLFPDSIDGEYISSDFSGAFANFTTDVSQSNFVSSSRGFAFNIEQAVGSGAGTFDFTPDVTIPVSSYLLKSTGHITLNISPA
jgi:hypothetical protein